MIALGRAFLNGSPPVKEGKAGGAHSVLPLTDSEGRCILIQKITSEAGQYEPQSCGSEPVTTSAIHVSALQAEHSKI
jgi:hypothetical protein